MSNTSFKEQLQAVASQFGHVSTNKESGEKAHKPASKPVRKKVVSKSESKSLKPKWLEHAQYGVELLKAYFPDCFKSGNEIKPLKVGIKQDLVKRLSTLSEIVTEDKACMVKSLSYYVNTASYHKSVVPEQPRIDLDGKEASVVSLEEANYAKERQLNKQNAKKGIQSGSIQQKNDDAATE